LAHETSDQTNKVLLLEMAQMWIRLAEQERARAGDDQDSEQAAHPTRHGGSRLR
jgi:hypothetical protein